MSAPVRDTITPAEYERMLRAAADEQRRLSEDIMRMSRERTALLDQRDFMAGVIDALRAENRALMADMERATRP
jgi:hypothetical protein